MTSRVALRALVVLSCVAAFLPLSPVSAAAAPATLCRVSDARLDEISGLVATSDGYAVINDGGDSLQVFLLDRNCGVTKVLSGGQNPFDPEDLARTSDGTFWVADIGDNNRERQTLVVWAIGSSGGAAVRHRLSYPDGAHDAEAILMPADKTPIIVTKSVTGASKVYTAPQPLSASSPSTQQLKAAGTVTISASGTKGGPSEAGPAAQMLVTGGAVAPNGGKVAVRTYTDIYEWTPEQGASAAAIAKTMTAQAPRRTPVPDEPQGEALSYTSDGSALVTVSEGADQPLQQWATTSPKSGGGNSDSGGGSLLPELTLDNLMRTIYITGILGLIFLGAGIFGIVRFRKRRKEDPPPEMDEVAPEVSRDDPGLGIMDDIPEDPYAAPLLYPPTPPDRRPPARGTTYGAPAGTPVLPPGPSAAPVPRRPSKPQGVVYGSGKPAAGRSGTVYGGGPNRPPGE